MFTDYWGNLLTLKRPFIGSLRISALCLLLNSAHGADWTCTDTASMKEGDSIYMVCGVAISDTEGDAREKAGLAAKREFDFLCNDSASCRDYEVEIEPLRTDCHTISNEKIKCVRGLRYFVTRERKKIAAIAPVPAPAPQNVPPAPPMPAPTSPPPLANVEPEKAPIGIGISTYRVSLSDTISTLRSSSIAGNAIWASVAFTPSFAIRANLYFLGNSKSGDNNFLLGTNVAGKSVELLFGGFQDRAGGRVYSGFGGFSETWDNPTTRESSFEGLDFLLGFGYNWTHVSFEWSGAIRAGGGYAKSRKGKLVGTTSTFILSYRF